MIDLKYFKLIIAISENGSLKKASSELNLTQSALSHQLKNIEEQLEISLFHRKGNRLYITEAGKKIKEKGELILNELNLLDLNLLEIKEDQTNRYIHGYSDEEAQRLKDQANSIQQYLHYDTLWENGARILEVGCGVGAQTEIIAIKNPHCQVDSIDISKDSIELARQRISDLGLPNVHFIVGDVAELHRKEEMLYDHVFICFVLEHINNVRSMLKHIYSLLKDGGSITIIEGDHGSTFFYPENNYARKVIHSQVALQKKKGGNANIGREIYPILQEAGFKSIKVSPRQIYVDNSKPKLVDGFIRNTFTAMMKGIEEEVIQNEIICRSDFDLGIDGLLRTTKNDGVFSYTFFKGKAIK